MKIVDRALNVSIGVKINGIVATLVMMVFAGLYFFGLPVIEERMIDLRREGLKNMVETAVNLCAEYDRRARNRELSESEAQKKALEDLRNMKYADGNGYFWVNTMDRPFPTMLMNAASPELEGNVLDDPKFNRATMAMPVGKKDVAKEFEPGKQNFFQAMVDVVIAEKEGYVRYVWKKQDESGRESIAPKESYVRSFGAWRWVIGTGMYIDDIQAEASRTARGFLLIGFLSSALLVLISYSFVSQITRSVYSLVNFAESVSGGNLQAHSAAKFHGEIERLYVSILKMVTYLREKIDESQRQAALAADKTEKAEQASAAAQAANERAAEAAKNGRREAGRRLAELISKMMPLFKRLLETAVVSRESAGKQRDTASTIASAISEMSTTVHEIARLGSDASAQSESAASSAIRGSEQVSQVKDASGHAGQRAGELQEQMGILRQAIAGIEAIVSTIQDIADQTNLLALNAAIEAARAGDAGRGFSVVADEVRKLAEKTMRATDEVTAVVRGVQKSAMASTGVAGEVGESISAIQQAAQASQAYLNEIVGANDSVSHQIASIAAATEEQSVASEEINRSAEGMSRLAASGAKNADAAEAAVSSVNALVEELGSLAAELSA